MTVKTVWIVVAVAILVVVASTVALFLSGDRLRLALLRQIEAETGLTADAESARVRLFPRPALDLSGLVLSDSSTGHRVIAAPRLEVVLQALPIFQGRAVVSRLLIEQPSLELRRDRNGEWGLPLRRQPSAAEPSSTGSPLAILAVVRNVYLTDGRITVFDATRADGSPMLHIGSLQAIMTEGLSGLSAGVQVFGEISSPAGPATFSLEGTILHALLPQDHETTGFARPQASVQFEGRARLDNVTIRQVAEWAGLQGPHGGELRAHLSAKFRLSPRPVAYDLIVSEWIVAAADLSVRGEAVLSDIGTSTARFTATASSTPFGLKPWLGHLAAVWGAGQVQAIASRYQPDATIQLHTATITGSLSSASRLEVGGQIQVRNGRFLTGTDGRFVESLDATILVDSDRLRVNDVVARYGPIRIVYGDAIMTDLTGDPKADVHLSAKVPADGLLAVLADTLEPHGIETVYAHVQQASGEIVVAAHLGGSVTDLKRFELLDAEASIRDGAFRDPSLPAPIDSVNGRLTFSSGTVRVEELKARLGAARIQARGRVTITEEPVYEALTVEVEADGEQLTELLRPSTAVGAPAVLEGTMRLKAGVSGALRLPRVVGTLDFRDLDVKVDNVPVKSTGAPAAVKFAAALSDTSLLTVSRLDLVFPPVRIAGHGSMRFGERPDFDVSFSSGALVLSALPRGISPGPLKSGTLDAVVALKGLWTDRTTWQVSGLVRLDDGVVRLKGMGDPISGLSVRVKLDGDRVEISRLALKKGNSDLRVKGTIANWTRTPRATLHVESDKLDLGSLRIAGDPTEKPSGGPNAFQRWLAAAELDAMVFVGQASYADLLLTGLSSAVSMKHGQLTVDRISGDTNKGHVAGRLVAHLPDSVSGQVEVSLRANGIPLHPLLALVTREDVMTGWLSVAGQIRGELGQSGVVITTLSSPKTIRVMVEDGSIKKVPLVANLLKVLNLPALLQGKVNLTRDGLPFNQFRGVVSIANGVLSAKELLLNSPVLKISGSGQYDLGADQFDMVLATSPLGSYSDLLKRVPVFGKLLAGDRQGFDTALFEVKGSAKDPEIRYMPAESLIRGAKGTAQLAFDLLVNAITLPKEMFSMAEDFLSRDDDDKDRGSR